MRRESEEWRLNYEEMLKKNEDLQENEFKLKTYQSMVEDLNKRNLELNSHNEKMKISCSNLEKHINKHTETERESSRLRQELKDREEQIL